MNEKDLIVCTGLTKYYSGLCALSDLNLTIGRGRIVGLLGPNGSGKSTTIKLMNGLLTPSKGEVRIDGELPGVHTHSVVSYLPERTYLNDWMKTSDVIDFFADFYGDFDKNKAYEMLRALDISAGDRLKTMSKGTKEKVQLILVMSRAAQLYVLDEPIGGVDPAARDYILNTILKNYSENSTVLISTHLISDIERVLDEVIFLQRGKLVLHETVDDIRETRGKSVDALFREVFAC
ncbi:MAG: ABC transporter ATP-binding protein [Clostridia bacterium]|nr:ABC transporter ATP-binding protein [Clostridia bacterium]